MGAVVASEGVRSLDVRESSIPDIGMTLSPNDKQRRLETFAASASGLLAVAEERRDERWRLRRRHALTVANREIVRLNSLPPGDADTEQRIEYCLRALMSWRLLLASAMTAPEREAFSRGEAHRVAALEAGKRRARGEHVTAADVKRADGAAWWVRPARERAVICARASARREARPRGRRERHIARATSSQDPGDDGEPDPPEGRRCAACAQPFAPEHPSHRLCQPCFQTGCAGFSAGYLVGRELAIEQGVDDEREA